METAWLSDLKALAETLNFSRAAEKRHITQPAFGRRIKSLEDWCGSELVDRSTHRLKLTPAGETMLEAADDIVARLERVSRDLEQMRTATSTVTFAATHALSFIFFPGWIQALGHEASTMPIRLLSDNMNECERIMTEGRAQFLLCHDHHDSRIRLDRTAYRQLRLATDRLIPVSGRDQGGQPLHSISEAADRAVPHLAFEETSGMGRILSSALAARAHQLHLSTVFTSHLAMALKALAIDGKGIAWIPESLAAGEMGPAGRLASAGPDDWAIDVSIVLIRPRARMTDIAESFWSLAQTAAAQMPATIS
ncbi:DNA-binding transcriptional LysR family regulator [Rhizobium sp. BK529]|uniref:LysR family transcriptional regulator n=1 Tax=unclassified Rhizobium TaxID=2613769 RepID=UPI001052457D|nr:MULTISPECIES: LysR family transcriptional regulator [unclassified Rhizobium]MBB3590500.1 DNA-binding transcriptional LysR family regulator [Rhizobium sp. BK529]TCS05189.1 DNA-binding transcriptional LysR family regulator [Rhizobium sp. BK418]